MKIGDLVQIKSPAFYSVGAYHAHLFDEKMLVTEIIEELEHCDPHGHATWIESVVVCISESGKHRFPMEDMEVVPEVVEHEIMTMALALAE